MFHAHKWVGVAARPGAEGERREGERGKEGGSCQRAGGRVSELMKGRRKRKKGGRRIGEA